MSAQAQPSVTDSAAITEVRRYGKYYLVRKIAEGGMAEIFLAKHAGAEGFERDVVIKRMLDSLSKSPDFVSMFLDEARLAARLFHPNIVQIMDLGVTDGRYYICMEYLPGEDLQAIVARLKERGETMPVALTAKIALAACEGLEFAHTYEEGGQPTPIVHRDVSPSNILVTYQGGVKVVDFGIAKAGAKAVKTDRGQVRGTWLYMAPEQARGEPIDGRADIFSLGLTVYELLTGRRVFARDSELAILKAVLEEPIASPRHQRPDIPVEIEAIVMRALARDVKKRYPTIAAMRIDLENFLSGVVSSPGGSHLGQFMQGVFGRERMESKTKIPTLKELAERGVAIPPRVEEPPPAAIPLPPASGAGPSSARVAAGPESLPYITAVGVPPTGARFGLVVIGAIGALILLAAGAGAAIYLRSASLQVPAPVASTPPLPTTAPTAPAPMPAPPQGPTEVGPRGAPRPPRVSVPATLTPKDIAAVVGRSKEDIGACFERHRTALPGDDGQVTLTLTILPAGTVSAAQVATPGFESSSLTGCIVQQIRALRFPRSVQGIAINVPFRYQVKR